MVATRDATSEKAKEMTETEESVAKYSQIATYIHHVNCHTTNHFVTFFIQETLKTSQSQPRKTDLKCYSDCECRGGDHNRNSGTRDCNSGTCEAAETATMAMETVIVTVAVEAKIMVVAKCDLQEKTAKVLSNMLTPNACIICDGVEGMISANEVVLGDVLILSFGDRTRADLRVIESANIAYG